MKSYSVIRFPGKSWEVVEHSFTIGEYYYKGEKVDVEITDQTFEEAKDLADYLNEWGYDELTDGFSDPRNPCFDPYY